MTHPRERIRRTAAAKNLAAKDTAVKVSVVVPCYNYGRYLADAVGSVAGQTLADFEIVVVDDGSDDNSEEVCSRLLETWSDLALTVVRQDNSGQPAIPRNRGIELSRGDYLLCLDADDKLCPGTLAACSACLDANEAISIAYPCVREFDGGDALWAPRAYDPAVLLLWNFIPTAAMFRRRAWQDVGGYATNVISHEDWNFWIACATNNHFGALVKEATFHYRIHGGSLIQSQSDKARRLKLKAQVIENHPSFYTDHQRLWARGVLRDVPAALATELDPSYMPSFKGDPITPATRAMMNNWRLRKAIARASSAEP